MEKPEKKIVNKRKADDSVAEGKKKAGGKKSTGASPRKAEKRAKKDDNGGKAADKDAPPERPRYVYGNLPEGFKVMPSAIPNKMKRSEVYQKIKAEKKRLKSQERNKRQKERAKLGDKVKSSPYICGFSVAILICLISTSGTAQTRTAHDRKHQRVR